MKGGCAVDFKIVQQLVEKFHTNDPFVLARECNIKVLFADLGHLRGMYQYYKRARLIFLNQTLPHGEQRAVCAHELGHALLHPKMNRFFLHQNTFFNCDRWEREANLFAAHLLIDEADAREYVLQGGSIQQIAAVTCLPADLVEARMRSFVKEISKNEFQREDTAMR